MLRAVAPEQGEYIRGHAGRLSFWNGFRSVQELVAFLERETHGEWQAQMPVHVYRLMAPLSGLDPAAYLKAHSLLPFCRVGARREEDEFDYEGPASFKGQAAWLQPRKGAYLCPSCVARDEGVLGYSYWRAFHQLPGIDACPTHGTALAVVGVVDAFDRPPAFWAAVAEPLDDKLVSLSAVPAVVRYTEIARQFIARGRRVSRVAAGRCIKARLLEIGSPADSQGRQSTLAHCIRDCFPAAWLEAHYPRLHGEQDCEKAHAVNGLCDGFIASGIVYAMALSAIFSTSGDALRDFYGTPGNRPSAPRPLSNPLTVSERRERLLPYYIEAEGVATRVAEMLGMTQPAVITLLRSVGLRVMGGVAKRDRERIFVFLSRATRDEVDRWIAAGSKIEAV
ncbi:TniQ family protein [Ralstonia wenshanensis]|uniref:TniQ family protein n=1 Tax=Ralstonia wenshanensis TaxID=2842456 RepID=UPI002AACEFB8|nr:TniQ family protein [Ralstonia wenshanensis]MDY7511412.1 TniQ family protein [Ralstonia wenshanensis]